MLFCADGFQLGADGCEVCICNQKRLAKGEVCYQFIESNPRAGMDRKFDCAKGLECVSEVGVVSFNSVMTCQEKPVVGTDCSTWAPYKCNDELVFYSEATDCKELCPDEPIIMDGNWAPPEPPIIMDGNWAPPTECPEVLCEMFCEDGFQLGADGCEVCSCNQKPRSVCSMDADCAEDSFCSSTTCRPYSVRVCA